MPCYTSGKLTVCIDEAVRLRTNEGKYIFAVMPYWSPPEVYHDRARRREVARWFLDEDILEAIKWFETRGRKG